MTNQIKWSITENKFWLSESCNFKDDTCGWIVQEPNDRPGSYITVCGIGGSFLDCKRQNSFQDGGLWGRKRIQSINFSGTLVKSQCLSCKNLIQRRNFLLRWKGNFFFGYKMRVINCVSLLTIIAMQVSS